MSVKMFKRVGRNLRRKNGKHGSKYDTAMLVRDTEHNKQYLFKKL